MSRLSTAGMFAALLLPAATGLVRAGTDLYHLPLGPAARYVATPGTEPSAMTWQHELELGSPDRLHRAGQLKLLTGVPHKYGSWVLMGLTALHIEGVLLTEIRQHSGLISTMPSGRTPQAGPPLSDDPDPTRLS